MLFHIESHQARDRRHGVKRVQVQPLVLQSSSPSFDQRVREADLCHGKHTVQKTFPNECVDVLIDILDSGVSEDHRTIARRKEKTRCLQKDRDGVSRPTALGHLPGEDLSGEVVDDAVEVRLRTIEKPDHGCVNVPDLIRSRCSNPSLRLRGMNALAWPSPVMLADQSVPCRRRGKDLAEALSENSQGPCGNVAVLFRCSHCLYGLNFYRCELMSGGLWTGRPIIEATGLLRTLPRMEAG